MSTLWRLTRPLFHRLDPECAHRAAIRTLAAGLAPAPGPGDDPRLAQQLFGRRFANPLGLAAGFDKSAEAVPALQRLGFGFVEIGSVTPRPQAGNPKPRLFRLGRDGAVINRMGFNNDGEAVVAERLAALSSPPRAVPVGVNLGKNKETEDAAADYERGVRGLARYADYVVVNVSSPNTPGLRALQGRDALAALLGRVQSALDAAAAGDRPALLLKVAPDLTDEDKRDIARVVLDQGLDGLIATNTTIARPAGLADPQREEPGGLSGRPLFEASTGVLRDFHELLGGRVPLIGVGGVASAEDAYAKIRAGASLVQVYSALVYDGPGLVRRIADGLAELLARDGHANVRDAVGADRR